MSLPHLRKAMEDGFVLSAWLGLPDPLIVECFARAGFDAVTLDVQHGLYDAASMRGCIERAVFCGKPALVRLPIGDLALGARALDFGACGVVMPMVETAQDAKALVAAVKYAPNGQRSFGPVRAAQLHGYESPSDYVDEAKRETLAFAMIETSAAMDNLEEILALDGLDGVFVGPSDLSIALSPDGKLDPAGDLAEAAIDRVASAASKTGKIAAIYAVTPDDAHRYRAKGYSYVCVGSDVGVVASGAAALSQASRA